VTTEQVWLGAAALGVTGLALVALVLALLARGRARRAEALVSALVARIDVLESAAAAADPLPHDRDDADAATYVITHLDEPTAQAPLARPVDGRLFADIVARETVVKAASWTHGLRRALSPANRNRIRFEVRQETRRAGRDRRAETKQALREFRARERATAPAREVREDVA
jgi:type II secretory pathway pseudopilin PulG